MNPATNLAPKLAQLYPGVYDPDGQSDSDGACGGTAQSHPARAACGRSTTGARQQNRAHGAIGQAGERDDKRTAVIDMTTVVR